MNTQTPIPKNHAVRLTSRHSLCGGVIYRYAYLPEHADEIKGEAGIIAEEIRQHLAAFRPITFWRSEAGRLDYVELPAVKTEAGE